MRNESIFPQTSVVDINGTKVTRGGLTLRDYFAAKWMNGYIANPDSPDVDWEEAAAYAYHMADAMLAQRERDDD